MRFVVLALAALVLGGCTTHNPASCAENSACTDPSLPYCDVDGSIGGKSATCIAVSCTPGAFTECQGDRALTCNAAGDNYELTACERGCDSTFGCRQCSNNNECANPSPVCDATSSSCRACLLDDECDSKVCDSGACLAEAGILYAAPNGSDTSSCTLAAPCTIERVQMLAVGSSVPPLVRLLPGVYAVGINIGTPTNTPVRIVASGATLAGQTPIRVSGGGKVEIHSVLAIGSMEVVSCTSSTSPRSALSITGSVLRAGSSSAPVLDVGHAGAGDGLCDVSLKTTELDSGASTGAGIFLSTNAVVTADRVHMHGTNRFSLGAFGNRVLVSITNSVLENVGFTWTTGDTSSPGSSISMGFNTMHFDQLGLNCQPDSGSAFRVSRYENNIIFATNTGSAVDGADCVLDHNLLYPYPGSAGSNILAQPQFVDQANRDYHLSSTSPAIDRAVPSAAAPATFDFDGVPRPQGSAPDIGAFELKP